MMKWDEKTVRKIALRFKSRLAFKRGARGPYDWASRQRLLSKICSHMDYTQTQHEMKTVQKIVKDIKKVLSKKDKVITEFYISERKRVDILVRIQKNNLIIPIEVKSDNRQWSHTHIKKQLFFYDKFFKKEKNAWPCILVSEKGRYGMSRKEFICHLKQIIRKGKK